MYILFIFILFLLFIPLALGAFILELSDAGAYFNLSLVVSFVICLVLSLFFLRLLLFVVKRGSFWIFAFYNFIIGILALLLHFLNI